MKIKVTVNTGFVGADHVDYYELPPNWENLNEDERHTLMDTYAQEYMQETIESYGELVEDDEEE